MRKIFFFLILGAFLLLPQVSWAAEEIEEVQEIEEIRWTEDGIIDKSRADDWFTSQPYYTDRASRRNGGKDAAQRYLWFYEDDILIYYLDTQSIRWINIPYSSSEYILDVWIRMEPIANTSEYSYPQKYYMEHYYLRPSRQQIQFLSELEVTERPQNTVRERKYNYNNWENLVPGSIEERVYHAVLSNLKELEKSGIVKKRKSDYDFWDDTLRIGGIF